MPGPDPHIDAPSPGDDALIEDDALHYAGPWARAGRLVLTADALTHTPTGTLDQMVGATAVTVPVDRIDGVEMTGVQRILIVREGRTTHRFGGPGAARIHRRLAALLDERDGTTDPGSAFVPGERVRLHGPMERFLSGPLGTRGHLTLTDLRLRFEAGTGLERLLWDEVGFDLMLDRVRGVSLRGVRQHLVLQTNDGTIELGGTLAPRVHAILAPRIGDPTRAGADGDAGDARVLGSWDASVRMGPLVHGGTLDLTASHVHFHPTGALGPAMGARAISLRLHEVQRVRLHGWPERRIALTTAETELSVGLEDAVRRYADLLALLRQALHQLAEDAGDALLADARRRWGTRQGWADQPVHVFEPALRRRADHDWEVGLVVMTRELAAFAPFREPGPDALPFHHPLRTLQQERTYSPDLVDQLRMRAGKDHVVLHPVSGRPFVRGFWKRARPPARVVDWSDAGVSTQARLAGPARYVRLGIDGRTVTDQRPGFGVPRLEGWGTVVPAASAGRLTRAPLVEVEVGQPEGVYRFEVRPVGVQPAPLDLRDAVPKGSRLLLTSPPRTLRVYNKRARFRAPLDLPAMASCVGRDSSGRSLGNTDFRVRVEDLSTRGVAIRSPMRLAEDTLVRIHLRVDDIDFELVGRVVREDEADAGGIDRRYALRLESLSEGEKEDLHRLVMARQRALLTVSTESDDRRPVVR